MKKSKILVPAVALLALSMGAAATGTVAWYSMSNAAVATGTLTPDSIASASTTAGLGTFTINVTVDAAESVCLSNDSGKTFVTDGVNNVEGTSAADPIASPDVTLAVSYATVADQGPESLDAATILGLWQAAIDGKTLTLTFTKATPTAKKSFDGDGSKTAFQLADTSLNSSTGMTAKVGGAAATISSVVNGLVTLSAAPAVGSGNVVIEYSPASASNGGVKFTSGATDYQQNSGDNVYTIAESSHANLEVASFSTPSGSKAEGWSSTATMDDGVFSDLVFMGLIGLNSVIQDDWQYSYTFTASIA